RAAELVARAAELGREPAGELLGPRARGRERIPLARGRGLEARDLDRERGVSREGLERGQLHVREGGAAEAVVEVERARDPRGPRALERDARDRAEPVRADRAPIAELLRRLVDHERPPRLEHPLDDRARDLERRLEDLRAVEVA